PVLEAETVGTPAPRAKEGDECGHLIAFLQAVRHVPFAPRGGPVGVAPLVSRTRCHHGGRVARAAGRPVGAVRRELTFVNAAQLSIRQRLRRARSMARAASAAICPWA